MNSKTCLLLMLRAPKLGTVKTRLASRVGDEAALALYKAFVEDMLQALDGCGSDLVLCVDPADGVEPARQWLGKERTYLPQGEGDLGDKLHQAFAWAFRQGYEAAAALGSDIPQLPPRLAGQLTRLLKSEPALIGPSPDGGYWTIGFQKRFYLPDVFWNMPWSTPEVYARTMLVLEALQPAVLPEMRDMDTVEDLRWLAQGCPDAASSRTVTILRQLGFNE